jgi:transposase
MSSARRDGSVPASLTLRSPLVIRSPRRRCSRLADFGVTACHPLAATAVFPPRRLCGHQVSTNRRDGSVPTSLTLRSPHVICSPRRQCSRLADFAVTACHLLAATAVFPARRLWCPRVTTARLDRSVPPSLTFRSPRVICSPGRQCSRLADLAVTACHPLAATAVFQPC